MIMQLYIVMSALLYYMLNTTAQQALPPLEPEQLGLPGQNGLPNLPGQPFEPLPGQLGGQPFQPPLPGQLGRPNLPGQQPFIPALPTTTIQPPLFTLFPPSPFPTSGCTWDFLAASCKDNSNSCRGKCANFGSSWFSDCRCAMPEKLQLQSKIPGAAPWKDGTA